MTQALRVLNSSGSPNWCTPPEVLDPVRAFCGGVIRFDPCTNPGSIVGALEEINKARDGLSEEWPTDGPSYINPPYGRALARWAQKIAEQARRGVECLTLVPARTDTRWWHTLQPLCWCAWEGRITFLEVEAEWRARLAQALYQKLVPHHGAERAQTLALERAAGVEPRRRVGALVANDAAPFPAALCYHGPRPHAFASFFAAHGRVYAAAEAPLRRPVGRPRAPLPELHKVQELLGQGGTVRLIAQLLQVPRNRIERQVCALRAAQAVRKSPNFQTAACPGEETP